MPTVREKAVEIRETLQALDLLEKSYGDLQAEALKAPVEELKGAWETLGNREHTLESSSDIVAALHQRLTQVADRSRVVAFKAMSVLNGLLKASEDSTLLATGDFHGQVFYVQTPTSQVPWALGLYDGLPEGHRVRQLLPQEDGFHSDKGPALVLGKAVQVNGSLVSADWYVTSEMISNTRLWRKNQLDQLQKYQEEERLRKEAEEVRQQAAKELLHPHALQAKIELLEKTVAELKSRGGQKA